VNWIVHGETIHLDVEGRAFAVSLASGPTVESATSRAHRDSGVGAAVIAPMPGQVRQVLVAPGDTVAAGVVLIILEAMKMENAVTAPASAKVGRILVDVGDQVQRGDVLVEFE